MKHNDKYITSRDIYELLPSEERNRLGLLLIKKINDYYNKRFGLEVEYNPEMFINWVICSNPTEAFHKFITGLEPKTENEMIKALKKVYNCIVFNGLVLIHA